MRLRVLSTSLILALGATALTAAPATARADLQQGECLSDYSDSPDNTYSMGLYAPEIYSNNGGAQSVRFRAQIWKKENGSYVRKATGAWDRGTARPETAYVGATQEFLLHPDGYGEGKYRARFQVQYLRADKTWSSKRTKVLRDYADYYKAQNTFVYDGDVTYCTAGPTGEGGSS